MGVAGLWEALRPAGRTRSLTHLAVKDGFEANPDGKRGFRVGIDASIWFYHATYGREGENPELRTLFFRCARLMSMPFLPLFVFDGPKRPEIKRGKRISGKNHWMVQGMQEIITAFGFEWRMAPGEAEAELAYLSRIGVIDAVLSDDVDTFLFGAKMVVRNPSTTLSGNNAHSLKNSAGKDDGNHVMTYASADFLTHQDIQLTQEGLILIGVMRGGDYSTGLQGCGVATAAGLARAGFGDSLVHAARTLSRDALEEFLVGWRQELRNELRTNSRGRLQRKSPSLAKSIMEDFPNIDVLLSYTNPVTSETKGPGHRNVIVDWDKEPDLGRIAGLCEMYFEWGVKPIIIKRFRTVLWPSAVLRILRRAAIIKDRKAAALARAGRTRDPETPRKSGKARRAPPGTPSSMITKHFARFTISTPHRGGEEEDESGEEEGEDDEPLIVKIHSSRRHPSTDNVLEYRLEIAPAQLVRLCEAGVKGLRNELPPELSDSEDGGSEDDTDDGSRKKSGKKTSKPPPNPESHLRIWLPACMVEIVEPELVEEFEGIQQKKAEKKAAKGVKGKKAAGADASSKAKKTKTSTVAEDMSGSEPGHAPAKSTKSKTRVVPAPKIGQESRPAASKPSANAIEHAGLPKVKNSVAAKNIPSKMTAKSSKANSNTSRVADLFKDDPPPCAPVFELEESSSDEELPRPSHFTRILSQTASSSSNLSLPLSSTSISSASRSSSSRILSFLDSQPLAGPSACSSSSTTSPNSPSKQQALRPFPIDLDMFRDDASSPHDEDLFATTGRPSSQLSLSRRRSCASLSSASDSPPTPSKCSRHSKKQSSPHNTPSKPKIRPTPRKEEEEESSDADRRPASPPLRDKGRSPRTLGSNNVVNIPRYALEEEEEESDRAASPSPMRRKPMPAASGPQVPRQTFIRKPAPLPANLSIISISSDSDSDSDSGLPASILPPLQLAKARAVPKNAPLATTSAKPKPTIARKPPRKIYNTEDIIDLT